MKRVFSSFILMILAFLLLLNCSKESNPLLIQEEEYSGNLEIKTQKTEFYIGEDFPSTFASILATVYNASSDTFYSNLGDGYNANFDQEALWIARGTDGYFEKYISNNNWEHLNRGLLFEGSKVIRILPLTEYNLQGTAYIDSNTVGKFRFRIDYYKTFTESTDTLRDTSNTFFIYNK